MKLISWNVNGIRAVYKKGLFEFIEKEHPDIFCVQETKAHFDQVEKVLQHPLERKGYWSSAQRKGYSGVATFVREEVPHVALGIGHDDYDLEGRFVVTRHPEFLLYNIYFPNGSASRERHDFKQRFLEHLLDHLEPKIKAGERIIVVGDYNIAHKEIDIHDPVRLAGTSGFLPEERAWFDRFLQAGFVDTFRHFHPNEEHRFSWWSYLERGRLGNRGWRIDYICVTENLIPYLKRADILDQVHGSDHCPVLVEMEF